MEWLIRRVKAGDEGILAHIQTESWKAAFRGILPEEALDRYAEVGRATAMYRRLLENGVGNGYILEIDGKPHGMAFWDRARDDDREGVAELICIHSLRENWGKGYGTKLMDSVLGEIREAGYHKVVLWVFAENARARRFYEARGFAASGRGKATLGAPEVYYEREL